MSRITSILFATSLLAACGGPAAQNTNNSTTSQTPGPGQSTGQATVGNAAYGFTRVMASKTIEGEALPKDSRAIAMVFFASWCGHCRRELGALGELRSRYPGLRVIGLNAYEDFQNFSDEQRLEGYIAENAPWLTEIVSADAAMRKDFGKVPKIPTLFIYSSTGEVVAEFRRDKTSIPSAEELERAVAQAVADGA